MGRVSYLIGLRCLWKDHFRQFLETSVNVLKTRDLQKRYKLHISVGFDTAIVKKMLLGELHSMLSQKSEKAGLGVEIFL